MFELYSLSYSTLVLEERGLLAAKKLLHLQIILKHGFKLSSVGELIRLHISWILSQHYSLLGSSLEEEIFSLEIWWFCCLKSMTNVN